MCRLMQSDNQLTASLTGPGVVFIQSLPFHKLSQRIARYDDVTHLLRSYIHVTGAYMTETSFLYSQAVDQWRAQV
jgi:hypothetical protein